MSRRDQLFQAVDAVQGHVLNLIDTHIDSSRLAGPSSSSQAGAGRPANTAHSRVRWSEDIATYAPPHYQPSETGSDFVPEAALRAPPGQAQAVIDQMPRNRMVRGSGREARRAAALLREEQLRTGQLKTRHTFVSSSGRVLLDVHTVPQKHLTFMGGSAQRGRGAMTGVVALNAQPNERVSSIRLKIKAVVRVLVPRAGSPNQPFVLEQSHPQVEPCVEKELLLLQLETQLFAAGGSRNGNGDPTLLSPGKHEFPFSIDLPSESGKGVQLPPSFVLAPLNSPDQVSRPPPASKWEALQSSITMPTLSKEWASVKWYAKLTVERPGMLRTNERIFAPFVYLPPPPSFRGAEEHLLRRLRLANEVDTLLAKFKQSNASRPIDLQRLTEPFSSWETFPLNYGLTARNPKKAQPANTKADKPSLFSKIMFGAQVEPVVEAETAHETWTLSIPKHPFVFALRSGVPYILSRRVAWNGRGPLSSDRLTRAPNVGVYQRSNVYARGKGAIAGTTARFICAGTQPSDKTPVSVTDGQSGPRGGNGKSATAHRQVEHWLGIVDLPPSCAPCFETPILTLDYYLGVRSPSTGDMLHCEPIVLVCPPSQPTRVPPLAMAKQAASKTPRPSPSRKSSRQQSSSHSGSSQVANGNADHRIVQVHPSPLRPGRIASSTEAPAPVAGSSRLARPTLPPTAVNPHIPSRPSAAEKPSQPHRSEQRIEPATAQSQPAGSSNITQRLQPAFASAEPLTPIRGNTPSLEQQQLHDTGDEDGSSDNHHGSDPWAFLDDELTDMPPSYFEATGQVDDE